MRWKLPLDAFLTENKKQQLDSELLFSFAKAKS